MPSIDPIWLDCREWLDQWVIAPKLTHVWPWFSLVPYLLTDHRDNSSVSWRRSSALSGWAHFEQSLNHHWWSHRHRAHTAHGLSLPSQSPTFRSNPWQWPLGATQTPCRAARKVCTCFAPKSTTQRRIPHTSIELSRIGVLAAWDVGMDKTFNNYL